MNNTDRLLWLEEIAANVDKAVSSFERKLRDPREFYFAFGSEHEKLKAVLAEHPESCAALASAVRGEFENFCYALMSGLDGATGMSNKGLPVVVTDRNGAELTGTHVGAYLEFMERRV